MRIRPASITRVRLRVSPVPIKRVRLHVGAATRRREPMRFIYALSLSLLLHGFILSLQFGIPGMGLPGRGVQWDNRRAVAPSLNVLLTLPQGVSAGPNANAAPSPAPSPEAATQ